MKKFKSKEERKIWWEERMANMPIKYKPLNEKAKSGKSIRAAIDSFCLACKNWSEAKVRICRKVICPMHSVRPFQKLK